MEALQLKVALRVLEHAKIPACLVGEIALNYYNVPRVLHDIEICVPELFVTKAASALDGTGLFVLDEINSFDLYTEYKRGCPRLRSSSWISPPCSLVIFTDTQYGLNPLLRNILSRKNMSSDSACSKQITDIIPVVDVNQLPMPRLPSLFAGFCQRFLDTQDDAAMIAAEQLVDGMDLDEGWVERNLGGIASPKVFQLATKLVAEKRSRIDDFSENNVTCFIADDTEAKRVRQIPGYE